MATTLDPELAAALSTAPKADASPELDAQAVLRQLRESEALLDQLAQGAPIVVSVMDLNGVFLAHIGAGLKRLGLTHNQLRGLSVFEAFRGADDALSRIRAAIDGKESSNTQDLGNSVWDNWFGPRRDVDGNIVGALSISTDVTDRERARQAMAEQLRQLEEQSRAIRMMSVPIIEVWQGVLVVPVVGQLDSQRAAQMMEQLLEAVSLRAAKFAILDLTAVDVVDTATAQHLLRVVLALRLLGAQAMISGVRASVAQALVGLGVDLSQVTTVASLHAALRKCMSAAELQR